MFFDLKTSMSEAHRAVEPKETKLETEPEAQKLIENLVGATLFGVFGPGV